MFIVAHGVRSVMRLRRFLTREKQHYIRHIQLIELCGALGPSIPLQPAHVRDVFMRERSHRDKTNRLQTQGPTTSRKTRTTFGCASRDSAIGV